MKNGISSDTARMPPLRTGRCLSAWAVTAVLLSACSGGDGSGGNGNAGGVATTTMQGMAATGASIDRAAVLTRCASGAEISTTTELGGTFQLSFTAAHQAPCMVKVSGGRQNATLYSFISSIAGSDINVTPITDLIVSKALGADPADAFKNFDAAKGSTITNGLTAAKTWVETQVRIATGDSFFTVDPLTGKFAVGDANDKVLDALGSSATAASKSWADLRAVAVANAGVLFAKPLTFEITGDNALLASQISMSTPVAVMDFIDGITEDVPESVFDKLDAINRQRAAGVAKVVVVDEVTEACSGGGTVTVRESDTSMTIVFDNCIKTQQAKIAVDMGDYIKSKKINGTVVFTEAELKDYPEAMEVMINLTSTTTDNMGRDQHSSQKGFLVTGDDDDGYAIEKMTLTTRYWGKTSASATPYDYSIEAQDFSVRVNEAKDQESFSGVINAKGVDKEGNVFPGGAFRVEMVTPLNNDETMGEYKIVGAKNSSVVTRLDPNGFYLSTNNAEAEFYPWTD